MQNERKKILITGRLPDNMTFGVLDDYELLKWESQEEYLMPRNLVKEVISDVDAIINYAELKVDEDLLQNAKKLKIVANASIGFDNLDIEALSLKKIWACNSPGYFSYAVAEYILAGMLTLSRRIKEADQFVRNDNWDGFEPGRWDGVSLREQKLGIIGMGAIGRELFALAACIGMEVLYYDKFQTEFGAFLPINELLPQCDFISINVPLNKDTYQMANKNFIEKLKKGAIMINTSRGGVIDQDYLLTALKTEKLGGAILDVFNNEPHVPKELYSMKNVILTPHIAGGTKSSRRECLINAFRNVDQALKGLQPKNAINRI